MTEDNLLQQAEQNSPSIVHLAAMVVSAYVSNNAVTKDELPGLLTSVRVAIENNQTAPTQEQVLKATSAQIKKSISPDGLISFVDGKSYKMLRRHLTRHGLTFEEYKARYGLPSDYPSVAANYSETRSKLAIELGLGQQRRKTTRARKAA